MSNRLVQAALPLLMLMTVIRHSTAQADVAQLQKQMGDELRKFEQRLSSVPYPAAVIKASSYCLCTAVDEAVLNCAWGGDSLWAAQSLLSAHHHETWGGERFYAIVERLLQDPRQHIDFLEFCYSLLSLGFEGKFFGEGVALRDQVRQRLFYRIRYAKKPDKALRPYQSAPSSVGARQSKRWHCRYGLLAAGALLVSLTLGGNILLYQRVKPTLTQLDHLAVISPVTAFGQLIQRSVIPRYAKQEQL